MHIRWDRSRDGHDSGRVDMDEENLSGDFSGGLDAATTQQSRIGGEIIISNSNEIGRRRSSQQPKSTTSPEAPQEPQEEQALSPQKPLATMVVKKPLLAGEEHRCKMVRKSTEPRSNRKPADRVLIRWVVESIFVRDDATAVHEEIGKVSSG